MKTRSIIRVKKYKIPKIRRSYLKLPKLSTISPQLLQKQYYQYRKNITLDQSYSNKVSINNTSHSISIVNRKETLLQNKVKHYSPSITQKGGLFRFSQKKNISFLTYNESNLKQIQKKFYSQSIFHSLGKIFIKKLEQFTKEKIYLEIKKQNYFIRETFETHKILIKELAEKITILERSSINELRRFLSRINT